MGKLLDATQERLAMQMESVLVQVQVMIYNAEANVLP